MKTKKNMKVNPEARRALVGRFAKWVKRCIYIESPDRTDAALEIAIEGITGGNKLSLAKAVGCNFIDKGIAAEVAMKVASRFCDAVSIEDAPDFRVVSFKDVDGKKAKGLIIKAKLRLVMDEVGWLCNTDGEVSLI